MWRATTVEVLAAKIRALHTPPPLHARGPAAGPTPVVRGLSGRARPKSPSILNTIFFPTCRFQLQPYRTAQRALCDLSIIKYFICGYRDYHVVKSSPRARTRSHTIR